MKFLLTSIAALATSCSLAFSAEGWETNWQAAKERSKTTNKPILINLTGSDWCGWCIKIEKEIFSKKEFKDFATENLILMEVDFPRKKELPAELKQQNEVLKKEYLAGGYPTVYLLDSDGKKLSADLGELGGTPETYVKKLQELITAAKK
jgi:protein disulfide-isomerase